MPDHRIHRRRPGPPMAFGFIHRIALVPIMIIYYELHTEPDEEGKRQFTLTWNDKEDKFRTDLGTDGQPVGHRRGQLFYADFEKHKASLENRGHTVLPKQA